MTCPLEAPNCKRILMTSNKPFEKKQCPLNIKPKCSLSPPACPLLPQKESKCGYAKLMGGDANVNQCPCKTCFLAEGCPISLNPCPNIRTDGTDKNTVGKWPGNISPCLLCTVGNEPTEKKPGIEKAEKTQPDKTAGKMKNTQIAPKCLLISSPRPLPCSECILQELSADNKSDRKIKSCPYLILPNVCGQNCYCPDVPSVETGPLCPFAPKPCPCCATPRCPLSRKPDCLLQPKPPCCLQSSKYGICNPTMCPSSVSCFCGLCEPCCKPLCGICFPRQIPCSPTPPCFPCPAISDGGCGPCPLANPCLPPCCPSTLLCTCSQPACPLVNPCLPPCCPSTLLCSCSQTACPLVNPSCCSPPLPCLGQCCSSPSCVSCLLKKLQCFLDPCPVKSICPPIPPPCSLKSDSSDPNNKPKESAERTFHLPTCPSYVPPCGVHMSLQDQCPFSPNPCPISCDCPFPVSMSLEDKRTGSREQNIMKESLKNKSEEQRNSSKIVKFDVQLIKGKESEDSGDENAEEGSTNQESQCPYSPKCGATPLPTCPAAEILCPDIYIKPKKVEQKPCPFKKCMKKPGCPLGKLKPEVDCKLPSCPLTKEPDCPLGELVYRCQLLPKCSCTCLCPPPGCCSLPLPCPLNVPCECTSTDGHTQSFLPSCSADSTHSSLYSSSCFTSPSKSKYDFLDSVSCESNLHCSISNICLASPISLSNEKLVFDGCCCKNKYEENLSRDFSENSSSNSECPFEPLAPKRICQFAPPKCPLTPKPTTCPLTRKPDPCALSLGGELICPVKYPPCKKFPSGRCPMGDLNICDCDYPVSPCILPIQDTDVIAPPQYCFREDCCMGLPFPPSILKNAEGEIEKGPYYQFKDTKPGKEETKHYVKISKEPLRETIALFGEPKERVHKNWTIVRHGEGYRRCKTIAKKLEEMGPIRNIESQYDPEDCPIDKETQMILDNRKKQERENKELETIKINLGIIKQEEPKNKKNKKRK